MASYEHIAVTESGVVATIEIRRGTNTFVDTDMVGEIADVLEGYDRTPQIRAIVLCSEGKHFCAGADFGSRGPDGVAGGIFTRRHNDWGAPASPSSLRCMAQRWAPALAWP